MIRFKYFSTVILFLALAVPAFAAVRPLTSNNRVESAALSLGAAIPQGWQFVVLNESAWKSNPHTHDSHTAYSLLDRQVTYIRETYAMTASDYQLRQTIAHEMGHFICDCKDEAKANFYRDRILKGQN